MAVKTLTLVLLVSVASVLGASTGRLRLKAGPEDLEAKEYGPEIQKNINKRLSSLPDPYKLFKPAEPLKVDLATLAKGKNVKVTGYAEIFSIIVKGINDVKVDKAVADYEGNNADFPFDLEMSTEKVDLIVEYKFDALVEDKIPLTGEGEIKVDIKDANFGFKGVWTDLDKKLRMPKLDYTLQVPNFKVTVEGVMDDPDFSETIGELLTDFIEIEVLGPMEASDGYFRKIVIAAAKGGFNAMELTAAEIIEHIP